ncbi:helix-turn-helix domain-containing protein [Chondrinema litorale]|uniref:helix-turn-helix domain-containing protein n=1 Tax=Chondrinema litorale TaxID=2994555 RepID=UPI0025436E27|nr:helix-turn-helix transcriptional regulator [Chondrinema litorale]UZR98444.1 helix-turn-helix transcriptional regulator [Chondrinema litorale]
METIRVKNIAQCHQLMGISKPKHPLFSILRFEDINQYTVEKQIRVIFDFYQIALKIDCPGKLVYGQTPYDFDEGVLSFFAPKQVNILDPGWLFPKTGWLITLHSNFLRSFSLDRKIKEYGFFDYAVNEALILSEDEETTIETILRQIEKEYYLPIDNFSQEVIITNLELLLTYCNRYYNRQFITRKAVNNSLLGKIEQLLNHYFENSSVQKGLPSVEFLASELNCSPKYLSDCLKQITGMTAQQHIHDKLIEKAKEKLSTTELSISEIAYDLGFEYSQSFSKLFKNKTNTSPTEFRMRFH